RLPPLLQVIVYHTCLISLSFYSSPHHPHLHSFPTRRSSDLLLDAPPDTALVDVHAERPESARDALSHALILVRRMRRLVPMNQSRTMTIAPVAVVVLILAAAIFFSCLCGYVPPAVQTIDHYRSLI